ncbi:MATE family efflux transporter [Nocardiopsis changdeensis]|uniref:Probable multidrug resistance protein NorM n=1 Tax=Nocardiopsis changdeensis TaxID=2831969 RepID=A0ABX8BKJ1_9ACTN|nr:MULTISPECIES: MATE family efflux transporter [Nocardiopsis]QUX22759.1 MATE family efflux transporter [Nocardiopsis changdeensis]QYX38702.1 MATE family efflux transporter [Nocardiopsis sp. MT53]
MPRPLSAAPFRHRHDREIFALAIPTFFALVSEPLFLLTDSAIVGTLGTSALAGLGIAGQVLLTLVAVCIFLAYGTTAAVARKFGAGDVPGGIRDGIDGLWLAVLLGAAAIAIGWPLGPAMVDLLGASPEVAPYALVYLRVSLLSTPFLLIVMAGTGVLRGLQDARTPLAVAVASFLGNALLCAVFVLVLDWGIAGSAWATVIAQGGGAFWYVAVMVRRARSEGVSLAPSAAGLRASASAGFALFLRSVSMRVVALVTVAVAARLGDAPVAAHQVSHNIWALLVFAMDAIAIAGQAIVGRYLGAGDVRGTRDATRRMVEWGVMLGTAFTVLVLLVLPWAWIPFTSDPQVRVLITASLVVVALLQPLSGVTMVLDGVLMGAGDQRYLAWASLWTMLAFLPFALVVPPLGLSATGGIVALWIAYGIWILARAVALGHRARGTAWLVTGASRP